MRIAWICWEYIPYESIKEITPVILFEKPKEDTWAKIEQIVYLPIEEHNGYS